MKLIYLLITALTVFLLAGCYGQNTEPTISAEVSSEVPPTFDNSFSDPTVSTLPATEAAPAEETIPTVPALDISAGAYPMKYEDAEYGTYMEYYVFIPENATENMPLVIFLHGDGEVGKFSSLENNDLMVNVRKNYGDDFPFIAISPCTRTESWINWPIPETLMNLIGEVVETYAIDKDHIIITGHSRGAVGVWHLVNTYGDYFSAAVPISCFSWRELQMDTIIHVPIRAFCGNKEHYERTYTNFLREQVDEIVLAGGDAEFTLFDGASHADTPELSYTDELFQWMLSQ